MKWLASSLLVFVLVLALFVKAPVAQAGYRGGAPPTPTPSPDPTPVST